MNDGRNENQTTNTQQRCDQYTHMLSPTGTQRSAPNTINTLDAHLGEPLTEHPQYVQPELTESHLATLADRLAERGCLEESARVEIERRHLVAQDAYAPTFTTFELTALVIQLVGVKETAQLHGESDVVSTCKTFADVIDKSNLNPLDERYHDHARDVLDIHNGDYVDPFRALAGVQLTYFLTPDGEPITRDKDRQVPIRPDGTRVKRDDLPAIPPWYPDTDIARQ